MSEDLFMTADEAALALGVSVTTVYAYVSRGMIRSQRVAGSKCRNYWRDDVTKIVHGAKDSTPASALPSNLVESTAITLITPQGHYYRGQPALELARTETLESIAALLWQAPESEIFTADLPQVPTEGPGAQIGDDLTPLQRAIAMLFNVEHANPRAYDLSPAGYRRSGADVLRCVAAACLGSEAPSIAPFHVFAIETLGASERYLDVVRLFAVLAADHELDPTTYAVRAAANTGVTPYAAAIAGLVSSSGRRLTFGQSSSVARLLDEIESEADPRDPVLRRIREGEPMPGFASKNYPKGDPRAKLLLDVLHEAAGDDADLRRFDRAAQAVHEATGRLPDFVLPAQILARKIDLRHNQSALLRIARVVGWVAHAMEQFHERDLVRPHAAYSGPLPAF
ncbi:citrate synthase [Phenylobacterium sp.]|uniref:citrate synthase n=1 Tax=Phenylobacterium sp. TaxID=1871053 RepID=UPI0035694955